MSYVSSSTYAKIVAQIAVKEEQLDAANETLTSLLSQEYEEYRFNSNEGMQQVKRKKTEGLIKLISLLEAQINLLYRRINGTAVHNLNVRRKRG